MQNHFRLTLIIYLICLTIPAVGQSSKDPFIGTFSGSGLTLTLTGQNGQYTGSAVFEGQPLQLSAQKTAEGIIFGSYTMQGQQLPFQAQIQGNTLTLTAGGVAYTLTRQTNGASAPQAQTFGGQKAMAAPGAKMQFAPGEVGDPYQGLKFKPPSGWIAQKSEIGYVIGSQTKKGFILILLHDYSNTNELRAAAKEGIVDESGTMLRLSGEVKNFGQNGVAADFTGTVEWQQAQAHAIGLLSPFGGGVTVMVAVEAKSYTEEYTKLAEAVAKSMTFYKPDVPPVSAEWKQRLSGARLTYLWSYYSGGSGGSYVGGSQETTIDLCQQGYFRYSDNNEMSVDGGSGAGYNASGYGGGSDRGNGQWEVAARGQQPILRLKFHDGRVFEYVLSMQDSKTYLDDKRYFRTYNDAPVQEHRPNCW